MRGVIDCNEWRTEKRHKCANMGKVKRLEILMATVPHVTSGCGFRKFQADGFLLTRVYRNRIPMMGAHCSNTAVPIEAYSKLLCVSDNLIPEAPNIAYNCGQHGGQAKIH